MEKYSAYRDPGTGIQPFLTPVPPLGSNAWEKGSILPAFFLGIIRTVIVLVLTAIYTVLVPGVCLLLRPIPPLHRLVTWLLTAILSRLALFVLGFVWIPVTITSRKRGRASQAKESWSPKAGDIIVSNWASWIEVLWLAFRFNPTFLVPVAESLPADAAPPSIPTTNTGRRTGTGSANVASSKTRAPSPRIPIKGFQQASLLQMIRWTGRILPIINVHSQTKPLAQWTKAAGGPIVIFPECTTSNARGLLNFASVFKEDAPTRKYKIFLASIRYDLPTSYIPSGSLSIASALNPLVHLFSVASSFTLRQPGLSIRLLPPSEGPSSPLFLASEILSNYDGDDQLSEACAILIAQLGKLKRTGMGWEDKHSFLQFYKSKKALR